MTAAVPHTLILSQAILTEVDRVLRYQHLQARWDLSESAIKRYVEFLEKFGIVVDLSLHSMPRVVADPDDDPILWTAIAGRADVLCTRDAAFRAPKVLEVCAAHGIRILDDIELIRELRTLSTS